MRILLLLLITSAIFSCLKEKQLKLPYEGYRPEKLADSWPISTPADENMDAAFLEKAFALIYQENRYWMARSLLVFRNAKLVAEAYPRNKEDRQQMANIQSCTKSVTSILMGIAIQNNQISDLQEPLYDVFPANFDEVVTKRNITVADALTMRTGLVFDNSEHTLELYQEEESSVAYVLNQDVLYEAGRIMNYNDGAPQLISKVIQTKTGQPLATYAANQLFTPLGISDWQWEAANDGVTYGAFSLYLTPRDFGKIGQLLLQEGEWEKDYS